MKTEEQIMLECEFAEWYSDHTGRVADSILSQRARLAFLEGQTIEIRIRRDLGQFLVCANGQPIGVRPIIKNRI